MSTSDWILIAIEGLVVIGFIALGVRSGGIGLGLWGGVGTLVLVFGFGLAPGEPPVSAMLIIIAVISASAAMQAAGGIDYMVLIASKALRARPRMLNFAAPYVSWLLDDPDRHGQHLLLPDPGDQRARLREQDQAGAGAGGLRRRLDLRHHREPGRRRDGDDAAARRGLRLRHRRRDADHDPGQHRRHLRDGARDEHARQGPGRRCRVPAPARCGRDQAAGAGRRDRAAALREAQRRHLPHRRSPRSACSASSRACGRRFPQRAAASSRCR